MRVFHKMVDIRDALAQGAVTIGNFDGVHRGHQALINATLGLKGGHAGGLLSFSPHPSALLWPEHPHFCLTSMPQKIRLFERLRLDVAVILTIDRSFLELLAEQFVREVLVEGLKMRHMVVGEDFSFGKDAAGNVELLKKLSKHYGFVVHVMPAILVNQNRCSSTAIRAFLEQGSLHEARCMLGRPFSFLGEVKPGQGKGRTLGFSPANLETPAGFRLRRGVYATMVRVFHPNNGQVDYVAATNVGVRPTVTMENKLFIETHCLDQELELLGRTLEVFFIERMRDEIKFSSIEALQEQVQKDVERIRQSHRAHPALFHVED